MRDERSREKKKKEKDKFGKANYKKMSLFSYLLNLII